MIQKVRCLNCMEEYESTQPICPHCGFKSQVIQRGEMLEAGSILQGRYIVGAMRRRDLADLVYAGWDALFERKVMIMEYFPHTIARREEGSSQVITTDLDFFEEGLHVFLDDNEQLILLDGTNGLLNVYSVFEENGTGYVTMEYPEGLALRAVLRRDGSMSLEQAERLARHLSMPITAAHGLHFCHGQLSLDCCYQTSHGEYKLGSFNESGYLTGDVPKERDVWDGLLPDMTEDTFSLVCIIGCALTGVDAWEGRSLEENLEKMWETQPEYVADVMEEFLACGPGAPIPSVRSFLDRFTDEATLELPPLSVLQESEGQGKKINVRRNGDGR